MNKTVLLGVTSGIAAYKTINLIKELRKENIEIFVVMTKKATKMISDEEFEKASGNKVFIKLFEKDFNYKRVLEKRVVDHIALADKTDVMVIAPASANIIAKLAHGIADDFLTTTALAVTSPVILCPSMNVNMWHNPVVQENINKLKSLGYVIINPTAGMLACGYEGVGRLAEIQDIKREIMLQLKKTASLKGKKIIITAGGTIEKIDNVRFIANRSSGKMGIALSEACYERGAEVLLLRSKNSPMPRYHLKEIGFETSEELLELLKENILDYEYLFHAAAVSDFEVRNKIEGKFSSDKPVTLELQPNIKIVSQIKKFNPDIRLIAFKAEYESDKDKLAQTALNKLQETNADAIIANDISKNDRGFESDSNEVIIVLPDGKKKFLPFAPKRKLAGDIVDYLNETLN